MGFGIWEVGTWQPVRRIPKQTGGAAAAFSPDGKVLAGQLTPTTACLFGTGTWRPLARLQGTDGQQIGRIEFTPDGTRLLVSGPTNTLRVWDLRQIREQLAGAGLDWDQPAYPPGPPAGDVKPVRVEVDTAAYERLAWPDLAPRKAK